MRLPLAVVGFLLNNAVISNSAAIDVDIDVDSHASRSTTTATISAAIPFDVKRLQGNIQNRHLEQDVNDNDNDNDYKSCEVQFAGCLQHAKCVTCFQEINENDIDWSFVAPGTTCPQILDALSSKFSKCMYLSKEDQERATFCNTFDACVVYEYADGTNGSPGDGKSFDCADDDDGEHCQKEIDCDKLTTCDFEGYKPNYIGDGICHEFVGGCYNHKICGYDGGDCCAGTCQNKTEYAGCGSDGYFCLDPKSPDCQPGSGTDCKISDAGDDKKGKSGTDPVKPQANCTKGETEFQLLQYDTFGDGWESSTVMSVTSISSTSNKDTHETTLINVDALQTGYEGSHSICLANEPTCYNVKLAGGSWANDISWKIMPMVAGSREIASGGSPMDCQFPVAGAKCDNTCLGHSNTDVGKDKLYQSYHDLSKCIGDKCVIQVSTCTNDQSCSPCMADEPPAYCLVNGNYTALSFCSQCNCVTGADDPERKKFCSAKSKKKADGTDEKKGDGDDSGGSENGKIVICDWEQRKAGIESLQLYSKCSNIEDTSMMQLFDFDNDNFGLLDTFEQCASEYEQNTYKNSALKCMQILHDAIDNPEGTIIHDGKKIIKDIPKEAISQMANDLLHNGHDFCDCASKATQTCPACYDFIRYKTLLYESIDACNALDNIDCGAWKEFSKPCKANIIDKFGKMDFSNKAQCTYIHDDSCGKVGIFPSLRQLDCSNEVSEESWDMYTQYKKNCFKDVAPAPKPQPQPVTPPVPKPTPPAPKPAPPVPKPTPKKYVPSTPNNKPGIPDVFPNPTDVIPNNNMPTPKKYVSPDAKRRHPFRNFVLICIVGCAGYWIYKRRTEFDYSQFRIARARNYSPYAQGNDGSEMYDSLSMTDTSGVSSFQPPSLPPPPSAYGGGVA